MLSNDEKSEDVNPEDGYLEHSPRPSSPKSVSLSQEVKPEESSTPPAEDYPHGFRLVAIIISLILATFLVALDNTIVGTAIPKITDDFQNLSQVSWYGAAYFMTWGGFQSMWGKLFKYFPLKLWFIISMLIFELGSLLCGVAPNSVTLIVGRAIGGLGGAGIAAGAFTIIGFAAPPAKRPVLIGLTGATYGVSAVLGPILGGVFSDKVSWRWYVVLPLPCLHMQVVSCFYINLPVGGLAAGLVFLFFHTPSEAKPAIATRKEKLLQMDLIGASLTIGFITSYLLALQYGGQTKPWNSSTVIGLLVGTVVIIVVFVAWEISQGERAAVVKRLFAKRYIWPGASFQLFFAGGYFTILYYLPIYFQSVDGTSPIGSGVRMLAMIIPLTITAAIQGPALAKIKIAPVFWVIGGVLTSIGCGLFYTMDETTSTGKWIGYQIIVGVGASWAFQTSMSVAQVNAQPEDMSQVTAIVFFTMMVGGSFFVSAADSAFNNRIISTLASTAPNIDPVKVLGTGATQIRSAFPAADVPLVVHAYVEGLKLVFAIAAAAFSTSTLIGFLGSWKRFSGPEAKADTNAA